MFKRLAATTNKMKDLNFWKGLVKNQGKELLSIILMNKLENLITEYLIRRPMEKAELLRRKNGYGPADMTLMNKIYKALFAF